MAVLKLAEWGEFLGTRQLGEQIRREIEALLDQGQNVVVNCNGVGMVSHSFADESIGKLAAKLGMETFQHKIRFRNVAPDIAPILRYVIGSRLSESNVSPAKLEKTDTSLAQKPTP